jgi:succinoglycan biosynthesis protein ExoA
VRELVDTSATSAKDILDGPLLPHGSRFSIGDSKYHYSQRQELVDHIPFGAYTSRSWRAIGGWDEELRTNEDYDFDFRSQQAGGRLLFDPAIVVDWRVREALARLAHQYYYGRGKFTTLVRYPSSLHLRWLASPMLVGSRPRESCSRGLLPATSYSQ